MRSTKDIFTAVVLSAAVPSLELTFKLYPNAAIDGFVLDEAGEPVRQAQLTLLAIPPAGPGELHRPPQPHGDTNTDDRGYYEFPGSPPESTWSACRRGPGTQTPQSSLKEPQPTLALIPWT